MNLEVQESKESKSLKSHDAPTPRLQDPKTPDYHITSKNLVCHELIGLNVKIKESKDRKIEGLEGRIADETMKTFVMESQGREMRIPKDRCVWEFTLPDGTKAAVKGSLLVCRPEDRTKKLGK